MTTQRKVHSNTAEAAVAAAQAANAGPINPPVHVSVTVDDRPFWDAVMRSRSQQEWTDADLVVAGQLARAMAALERVAVSDKRETPYGFTLANDLTNQVLRLMRLLKMQSVKDTRDAQRQRRLERGAVRAAEEIESEDPDGLLA